MQKIYINPGHSNIDPGAVGYETERRLNVAVSNHQRDYLLANYEDVEVKMTPGNMDSLKDIVRDANNWGADIFISNHFNAGKGDGYEALVYNQSRVALGRVFEKHIIAIGQNSRGVKLRPDLYVLKHTNMPAVLNEGAFVDNRKDIEDWNDEAELRAMGIAYAKAAAEHLALKKKIQTETKTENKEEYEMTMRTLREGCEGEDVKALQLLLNGNGYYCGTADRIFGAKTEKAVRQYQQDKKLTVDGIVGPSTMGSLMGL